MKTVRYLRPSAFVCGFIVCLCLASPGCAEKKNPPSTQPTTLEQRQDAMLRDPMGYKDEPPADVSGGKLGQFDKGAFKKDLDHVLSP